MNENENNAYRLYCERDTKFNILDEYNNLISNINCILAGLSVDTTTLDRVSAEQLHNIALNCGDMETQIHQAIERSVNKMTDIIKY